MFSGGGGDGSRSSSSSSNGGGSDSGSSSSSNSGSSSSCSSSINNNSIINLFNFRRFMSQHKLLFCTWNSSSNLMFASTAYHDFYLLIGKINKGIRM